MFVRHDVGLTVNPSVAPQAAFLAELQAYVGRRYGLVHGWDAVNRPMIRHWCEALDIDHAPFLDEQAALSSAHAGLVAPSTMLPVWLMPGVRNARPPGSDLANHREVMTILEREGYVGILGTNCELEYERPLRLGEKIACSHMVESISGEKKTAVGAGFFVTFLQDFSDELGRPVGRMRLRILRYRPKADAPSRPAPPQPALSQDTAFFWEGLKAGKLLIQRCSVCKILRHPPGPACTECHSLEWDTLQASGRGHLFSFVIMHQPRHPAFDYPHPVGLVELAEGVRLVAPLTGFEPGALAIGLPVVAVFDPVEGEHRLPKFRPADRH